jgi:hypothetical protein
VGGKGKRSHFGQFRCRIYADVSFLAMYLQQANETPEIEGEASTWERFVDLFLIFVVLL